MAVVFSSSVLSLVCVSSETLFLFPDELFLLVRKECDGLVANGLDSLYQGHDDRFILLLHSPNEDALEGEISLCNLIKSLHAGGSKGMWLRERLRLRLRVGWCGKEKESWKEEKRLLCYVVIEG